ncbi:MAG: hypothetical protein RLZZ244_2080 [Verrucomicrobiota bacterium]
MNPRSPLLRLWLLWLTWVTVPCLSPAFAAVATEVSPAEAQKITAGVFALFEAKCNKCHGSHLERPEGKFGYIMDFQRIAANAEYIVPGEPDKSEFFRLVDEDEMPGKKSKVPAATAEEKANLKKWIQIGAPSALPPEVESKRAALLDKKPGTEVSSDENRINQSFLEKLLAYLGRFHAASTHLPVGLLTVTILSEALAWFTKKESWLSCTRFLVVLGAGGAVLAAVLGWLNDYSGVSWIYKTHKWTGTATAIWGLIAAGCAVLCECREGTMERARLRVTLLLGALLVSVAGFLGGTIRYGIEHYSWFK